MSELVRQHRGTDAELASILKLIQTAFAYMDARINPPSSMHRLSVSDLAEQCSTGELWSIGHPITACMALKFKEDALYMGKLAVDPSHRNQGIGAQLIGLATQRAKCYEKPYLELETRVELTENHAYFGRQGFIKTKDGTHPGYTEPTYIVMRKTVNA